MNEIEFEEPPPEVVPVPAASVGSKAAAQSPSDQGAQPAKAHESQKTPDVLKLSKPPVKGCYIKEALMQRQIHGIYPGFQNRSRSWGGNAGRTQEQARQLVLEYLWECDRAAKANAGAAQ